MNITEAIRRVLMLQEKYSIYNTSSMKERGFIIRNHLPDFFREVLPELSNKSKIHDLSVEGRDGTGLKAEIPWVRFFSKSLSPSAQIGWYVVLLFARSGGSVFLTLQHASTQSYSKGRRKALYRPRSSKDIAILKKYAAETLPEDLFENSQLCDAINLGSGGTLAKAYESTTICAIEYRKTSLPDPKTLLDNLLEMLAYLRLLYKSTE